MTPASVRPSAPSGPASQHLAAIAASLSGHGIASTLTRIGGTPTLTIGEPAAGPDHATVTIDPDPGGAPGLHLDCTCIWTPPPGAAPGATAATIIAVLNALRHAPADPAGTPGPEDPWHR
jgi:hypothetical protein